MAYNPPDFYGPLRERRDTDVIYQGLADMGKGLASGINSATAYAGDMKKMDKQQAFAQAMQEDAQANQKDLQGADFQQRLTEYGMQQGNAKTAKAQERELKMADVLNYGKGRAAGVVALGEVSGYPGVKQMSDVLSGMKDGKAMADTADAYQGLIQKWTEEQQTQQREGNPRDVSAVPVPGTNYVIPYAGNKGMGLVPLPQQQVQGMSFEEAMKAYPDATIEQTPKGVSITRKPPGEMKSKFILKDMPGPMVPHPTLPGQMIEGPKIPARVYEDGTWEPLKPKDGSGGTSYGDSLYKKK